MAEVISNKLTFKQAMSKYTMYVIFVVLVFLLGVLTKGQGLRWSSLSTLIIQEAVRAFASLGVGMIIITWGIDLSIGYVVCFCASVSASFAQDPSYTAALFPGVNFPWFMPILMPIIAGGLFGLFNGILVAYGNLHPFVATLGTSCIARGLQLVYTHAQIIGTLKDGFKAIAGTSVGPIPILGIYVLIAALIIWVLMRHTKLGTNYYAIGGNKQAARVSGIHVERDLVSVYTIAGILYGIGGMLTASRLGMANALTANGMELDAIAAVTVGGVSQTGGVGTVSGMIVGVFIMGIINFGMRYLAMDSNLQLVIKGLIIIIAVYFDMKKYSKKQ
jgi:methyl-galactoside transport system permease protein